MDGAAMLAALRARFGSGVIETHDFRGDHTAVVTREALPRVLAYCRDEPALAFEMLTDLTAVDYSKYPRSEEHTSELQSLRHLVCRLLLEKKKNPIRASRTARLRR